MPVFPFLALPHGLKGNKKQHVLRNIWLDLKISSPTMCRIDVFIKDGSFWVSNQYELSKVQRR